MTGWRARVLAGLLGQVLAVGPGPAADGATAPAVRAAGPAAAAASPRGPSLFDRVFGRREGPRWMVEPPYPFEELLARLDRFAGLDPDGRSRLKRVLVPYGRSLQRRGAPGGDLAAPRIVVGVDTAGPPAPDTPWLLLKDRLFIGYRPAAAALEVMSFDERTGRFEFQVVRDYAEGLRPRTSYPPRRLCLGCHQNAGPIFARAPWSETQANPALRAALAGAGGTYPAGWLEGGAVHAASLDDATDRANLLPIQHLAWRELCHASSRSDRLRCRAGAVLAMVRHRMGPHAAFRPGSRYYREHFRPRAHRRWRLRWPEGLPIPNPDLADRDPLASGDRHRLGPGQDPLLPRPSLERWRLPVGPNRVLIGLGESLPDRALARLDAALARNAGAAALTRRALRGPCRRDTTGRLGCVLEDRGTGRGSLTVVLDAPAPEAVSTGLPPSMVPPFGPVREARGPDGTPFHAVETRVERRAPNEWALRLVQRGRELSLRLADGRRLDTFWLRRGPPPAYAFEGHLELIDDFPLLEAAAARVVTRAAVARDLTLDEESFRAGRWLEGLARALGAPAGFECCDATFTTPYARSEPVPAVPGSAEIPPWTRYCGGCHDQALPLPPPFLRGDASERRRRLTACAPMALGRLELWSRPSGQWTRSPMPPWHTVVSLGLDPRRWPEHPDYRALVAAARALAGRGTTAACAFSPEAPPANAATE